MTRWRHLIGLCAKRSVVRSKNNSKWLGAIGHRWVSGVAGHVRSITVAVEEAAMEAVVVVVALVEELRRIADATLGNALPTDADRLMINIRMNAIDLERDGATGPVRTVLAVPDLILDLNLVRR